MENLPPEAPNNEKFNILYAQVETFLNFDAMPENSCSSSINVDNDRHRLSIDQADTVGVNDSLNDNQTGTNDDSSTSSMPGAIPQQNMEIGSSSNSNSSLVTRKDGLSQVIEQFEPGVYITVDVLPNGVKAFKRVRFRCKYISLVLNQTGASPYI